MTGCVQQRGVTRNLVGFNHPLLRGLTGRFIWNSQQSMDGLATSVMSVGKECS